MNRRSSRWIVTLALLALASTAPTWAAEAKKTSPPEPTAEQRRKMAEVHQKMAECLRSTRPIVECRSEMVTACQGMLGAGACPMMGRSRGGMGPGMMGPGMGPGMMQGQPPTSTPPETAKK
jgi:hypothetical protein